MGPALEEEARLEGLEEPGREEGVTMEVWVTVEVTVAPPGSVVLRE